jgi:DNA-binding response OmpR family regulator
LSSNNFQNKKILIVEDDEMISYTIKIHLENSGYKIVTARNGEEAISLLNDFRDIDLIITDIRMPILDGIEFCRYVRNQPENKYLPILILTASSDSLTKYQGFSAGTDDYITKPFDPIELLFRIQALIRRSYQEKPDIYEANTKKNFEQNSPNFVDSLIEINGKKIFFTNIEFDLFYFLYKNSNRYITSEELLNKVMEYPPKTGNQEIIRTHIKKIRNKIETDPHNPEIIKTLPRKGYFIDKTKIN